VSYLFRKRAAALYCIFILMFIGLAGRMAYIQIYQGDRLSRMAVSQQSQAVSLETPARGQILDRNLKPLISYREIWRAAVFADAIGNKRYAADILADVLGIDLKLASSYLVGKAQLIPIDLNSQQAARLSELPIPGIVVAKVRERLRKPAIASHLLGYVGKDGPNAWNGKMGIELYYDGDLSSAQPLSTVRAYFDGRGSFISGIGFPVENKLTDPDRGNVVLTIDRDIQEIVEKSMDKAGVTDGAVVIMDARNGDILATASRPDYSLDNSTLHTLDNKVTDLVYSSAYTHKESFLNNALSFYQPGSVFKIIVAAAALEEGVVQPEQVFLCTGDKDDLVRCYLASGHGLLTFAQAFADSCNPTFARVGLNLGPDNLIKYGIKFGLGNAGIIGYRTGDTTEKLNRIAQRYSMVNASLGQWPVEATVVQLTAMTAVIANDGNYTEPRLVREVRTSGGAVTRTFEQGRAVRAVSLNTAEIMQTLMEGVTRYGTGQQAWVETWGSAGKTGSAQVSSQKTDAWFSGYAPLKEPRYVATVLINNAESGGKNAAPVFRKIMTEILKNENR